MLFEYCPRCNSKNWSIFQTGNDNNKMYYYTSYCNHCHKFSFSYCNVLENKCIDAEILEKYTITTDKFIIDIDFINNETIISNLSSINYHLKLDLILKLNLSASDKEISTKIQNLIILS